MCLLRVGPLPDVRDEIAPKEDALFGEIEGHEFSPRGRLAVELADQP